MATLYTTTGTSQGADSTAKNKLTPVVGTPSSRNLVDSIVLTGALAGDDLIGIRKVQGGSKILPVLSDVIEATTASALTLDIGFYQVATDGSIGDIVSTGDQVADGVDFAGSGVMSARPVDVPTTQNEYWLVAKVVAVTGTTVADETIDFYTAINSAN